MKFIANLRPALATVLAALILGLMPQGAAMARVASPEVSSVTVPANDTYAAGETMDFIVTFNKIVYLNDFGGTPRLVLTVGSTQVYANYHSGSPSDTLTFRYTVAASDLDNDGISVDALQLNGGTLVDNDDFDANLTLTGRVASTSGVLVDGGPVATAIPTLTEWAMILLALALAGLAAFKLHTRHQLAH